MKNEFDEKTCGNCKFFAQHYARHGASFVRVFFGHCTNRAINSKKIKRPDDSCELWEDLEIKQQDQKRKINDALIAMSFRLDDLTELLKDDAEN